MSDSIVDPGAPPPVRPAAQVDLTKLDDKHLGQYRHPNEPRALLGIVVGLAAIAVVIWLARPILGNILDFMPTPVLRFLSQWIEPTRLGLVLVGLLALTALMDIAGQTSRSMQLVARAVEVTPTTFPQLAPIVDDLRKRFDLPRTRVYVSRDAPPTGYTVGAREPHAIVFSSIGVGALTPAEFKFVLGCEMGSIKLGHTKMAVLMGNVNMSLPQPFSFLLKFRSVLFGTYHHAQALSCDRIGVVATRDVMPALSALVKQNLGAVRGAKIDIKSLAPQTAELNQGVSGAVLRAAMVLNAQPFAVARLAELVAWAGEPAPVVTTTPAAPAPPTPAASAAAAAKSAAAAAASAAAAAASAAEAAALLAPGGAAASATASDKTPADPAPPEGPAPATEQRSQPNGGPSPTAEGATPNAAVAPAPEPPGAGTTSPHAAPPESTGESTTTPSATAPEGGSVSVAAPQPPH